MLLFKYLLAYIDKLRNDWGIYYNDLRFGNTYPPTKNNLSNFVFYKPSKDYTVLVLKYNVSMSLEKPIKFSPI